MARFRCASLGLLVSSIALLGLALAAVPAGTQAQQPGSNLYWAEAFGTFPTNSALNGVFMLDSRSAWVVGGEGSGVVYRLQHQSGKRWSVLHSQSLRAPLWAVSAVADNNVWFVGERGLIVHYDGSQYREIPNPMPDATLRTIQMFGQGEEGWAGGYRQEESKWFPVLLHYIGGEWRQDHSISGDGRQGVIESLHFAPGGNGWLTLYGALFNYRDGTWHQESQLPNPCGEGYGAGCFGWFHGVRAIGADEAWAVGMRQATCFACRPAPYAVHHTSAGWRLSLPEQPVLDRPPDLVRYAELKSVAFVSPNVGISVGVWSPSENYGADLRPLLLSYRNGQWRQDISPVLNGYVAAASMVDESHALAVGYGGLLLTYGYTNGPPPATPAPPATPTPFGTVTPQPTANPAARVSDPNDPNVTYFSVVGHTLRGRFREYWQQYGGLAQFGYPLTEEYPEISEINGRVYTVQYFERARFEHHPENRSPYDVLLGLLGRVITERRVDEPAFRRAPLQTGAGYLPFPETGHTIPAEFSGYWQRNGGLPVYGYPISEPFLERSPTDGKSYLVQYFERNRFELHPELPEQFRVSLGLLGVDVLRARGWLP
jgi:hypothetical protein